MSPAECWRIVQEHKCGKNTVQRIGKTFSFTDEPEGEGKWHSLGEHVLLNCLEQEITLSATTAAGRIHTPFGSMNNSEQERSLQYGYTTIVWEPPREFTENICKEKTMLFGTGVITYTKEQGQLFDNANQMEILFQKQSTPICGERQFMVIGVPVSTRIRTYVYTCESSK